MADDNIRVDREGCLWRETWSGEWVPVRDTWGNHLREEGGGSGCFITTACAEARGFADDCEELKAFRRFRDGYVNSLPEGEQVVGEYYLNAPRVVAAIENSTNRDEIYHDLYSEEIEDVLDLLAEGQEREAFGRCMAAYRRLKQRYLFG